jgi:hypothetical protein
MSQAVSEQITVTAAAPVVDITSASTGANLTQQTMQSIPLGRNFVNAARVAPGTNIDASGVTFYGSSGAENEYIIDGLNTTGCRYGDQQKQVNIDFIQEVEVKTGGLPAEYGRMTGGTINAITKSGGNEYQGAVFGFDAAKGLRSANKTFGQYPATYSSIAEGGGQPGGPRQVIDGGGDLGGYFVKDRVWFFGAYDHLDQKNSSTRINTALALPNYSLPVGTALSTSVKRELWAGKVTFRLSDNQNIALSGFGDPSKQDGPLFAIAGPPSTFQGTLKTGGADFNGRYSGIFATSWVVNGEAGKHKETQTYGGLGASIPLSIDNTVVPAVNTGGFGPFGNEKYDRTVAKLDVNRYFTSHDVKFGGDFEDMKASLDEFQGGAGQRIYKFVAGGVVYYRHRYNVNDKAPGFDANDSSTWQIALPLSSKPETKNTSAYLQDAWRVRPNFTLSLGARWESQEVIGRGGVTAFKINNNWAPRLGFTWDIANNGRSKLYANYGRFYESIPMDINIRSFGGEMTCFCYNFSPDPASLKPDPTAPRRSNLLGNGIEPVDPNLKGQRIDELLAGYEYEIAPNLAVGIKGTYRKLANVIDDMFVPATGGYFIANPGSGIGREASFYDQIHTVVTPPAKRVYKGFELNATKRFSNNTQFFASYLWSRLEGNYDGTFQASTGQLDPNINSAFDYADFIVNNHGLLSNDRTHQLKFTGSYTFSKGSLNGLNLGLATHYASGTPLTAMGYSFGYANWEYYLTPRGALGRGPADYEADIQVSYPIPAGSARINLIADIFNVFNLQRKTTLDIRFNRTQDPPCAGIPAAICNGDGGINAALPTVNPVGTINTANAPNPDFLKAGTQFTNPRTIRLGARVTF